VLDDDNSTICAAALRKPLITG